MTSMEVLEADLRQRESTITSLEHSLAETQADLAARQREIELLRKASGNPEALADATRNQASVERIEIARLLTGGLNRDELPGDELLSILVSPRNSDGDAVRVPGSLRIEVLDFSLPDDEQRISVWEFNESDSARLWQGGVVGTGFRLTAPWQRPPRSKELMLHARLTTRDGRQLDTHARIEVNPVPADSSARPVELVPALFEAPTLP